MSHSMFLDFLGARFTQKTVSEPIMGKLLSYSSHKIQPINKKHNSLFRFPFSLSFFFFSTNSRHLQLEIWNVWIEISIQESATELCKQHIYVKAR